MQVAKTQMGFWDYLALCLFLLGVWLWKTAE